jgi:DNA-binding NtrC family response regulator
MEWRAPIAMIIDDDDDLTYLLENILKTRNINVLSVHSLHEAQDCLAYSKPSVVFLDNSFPDGIGLNFIGNIKSTWSDTPIIMMTSDPSTWVRKKAMEEGAQYFLEKPFNKRTIDQLLDRVNLTSSGHPAQNDE